MGRGEAATYRVGHLSRVNAHCVQTEPKALFSFVARGMEARGVGGLFSVRAEMSSTWTLNLFPSDSRAVRTHGRIEGREVSRDRCLRGDEGEQAAGTGRGQKTHALQFAAVQ